MLVLPHIVKLCELCENREQFRWIKDTMLKLQEVIHMENAVCHQVNFIVGQFAMMLILMLSFSYSFFFHFLSLVAPIVHNILPVQIICGTGTISK